MEKDWKENYRKLARGTVSSFSFEERKLIELYRQCDERGQRNVWNSVWCELSETREA